MTHRLKKSGLVNVIREYIQKTCFELIPNINASNVDLVTIGRNMKKYFDVLFSSCDKIDYVVIENQISPIANRMKTIQGMIAQYFIMHNVMNIQFVSAINKLKDPLNSVPSIPIVTIKLTYNERKKTRNFKMFSIIERQHML